MIWLFDNTYDNQAVVKWFEFADGQVAKISDKHKQGLDRLKLYN